MRERGRLLRGRVPAKGAKGAEAAENGRELTAAEGVKAGQAPGVRAVVIALEIAIPIAISEAKPSGNRNRSFDVVLTPFVGTAEVPIVIAMGIAIAIGRWKTLDLRELDSPYGG